MLRRWKILLVLVALVLILALVSKRMASAAEKIDTDYSSFAEAASTRFSIPLTRIKAMIYQESSGNPTALGRAGERGLMQLEPGALSDFNAAYSGSFSFDDLWNPETNITVGSGYLALLVSKLGGDLDRATQAYNAGIGNVKINPLAGLSYLNLVKAKEQYFV